MQACTLEARAKINLYLQILGRRQDGYHDLTMILQSINLADQVHLQLTDGGIHVECDHPQVPTDSSNLAYRAAELLQKTYHCPGGVEIQIRKRIPVAAGLAGGSTNAAAVLVGLNQLWGLGLTVGDLQVLASQLGSDIPFCISGGTQLASGRGEILEPLSDLQDIPLVLAKPKQLEVSTAWAYRTYSASIPPSKLTSPPNTSLIQPMLTAIEQQSAPEIARYLYNDLELPVLSHHTVVANLKQTLDQGGALGSLMSGSGPSVFGITTSIAAAETIATQLRHQDPSLETWAISTAPTGISLQL